MAIMTFLRRLCSLAASSATVALLLVACSGSETEAPPALSPTASATTLAATVTATTAPTDVTATSTVTPTPEAPPADDPEPSQPPTRVPTVPFAIRVGTSDEWVRQPIASGELIEAEQGALFVSSTSGEGELVALAEPAFFGYAWSPNGRWVLAHARVEQLLLDRTSGAIYGWQSQEHRLVGGPHDSGLLLLESQRNECSFAFVQLDGPTVATVSEFVLPPGDRSCGPTVVRFSPDLDVAYLLVDGPGSRGQAQLFSVAVGSGAIVALGIAEGESGRLESSGDGESVLLISASEDGSTATIQLDRYSWQGDLLAAVRITADPSGGLVHRILVSPDASSVAWQTRLPLAIPVGLGGSEHWPIVTVANAETGELQFRVVRASLTNGIRTLSWLADSSAIVVATPDGYALLSAQDGALDPLPLGAVGHFDALPLPAPDDASRFLFDGRAVDAAGSVLGATTPTWDGRWWSGGTYEWGKTSDEIRIARWQPPGRDFGPGGLSSLGLPARLEQPPFPDSVRLRVAGISHLELLAVPVAGDAAVATIANGTAVTVTDAGPGAWPPGCDSADFCTSATRNDRERAGAWFIHVRTPNGIEGWARSKFLAWAD